MISQNNMDKEKKIIAVFGSSSVKEDDEIYKEAEECGRLLALRGYAVINGGYSGVMEAASKGAKSAKGYVIGVPTKVFKRDSTNPFLDEIIWAADYDERIKALIKKANAYLIFKGGIGTLSELFYAWCIAQINNPHYPPIILVGKDWKDDIKLLSKYFIIPEKDLSLLQYADTPKEAIELLDSLLKISPK